MHRQGIIGRQVILAACIFGSMLLLQACTSRAPGWSFPAAQPLSTTTPAGHIPPAPLIVDQDTFHVAPAGAKLIALPPRLAQLDAALDAADLQAELDIFLGTPRDAEISRQALILEQTASSPADFAAATDLYHQAAIDGYAPAQFRLGVLTAAGKGVAQDDYTADRWYLLAAEQYHRKAQVKLGIAYVQGKGVAADPTLARLWIGRAADLGDPSGLYAQSQLYRFGIGGPIDMSEADRYCRIAAHAGLDLAKTDTCGS
jgi:TPR repeat protein